ncbi:MAG: hypothetical protein LBQ62_06150 [Candidatus Accumulibacter sp.]|jgi:hypothetical protein|nr:hypothetical protein [Accumulibacter sp.]
MDIFTLKLILTPTLIGLVSLAGRRWGAFISGWLVGLPLTSGPIVFFLAADHDTAFAAAASLGVLSGTLSQALFCLAYAWACTRLPWRKALPLGLAAFAAATVVFNFFRPPVAWLFLLTVFGLAFIYRAMPIVKDTVVRTKPAPVWDIPARMIVATLFIVGLTEAAERLGPHLTGLLSPFPLYALILAVFSQHFEGPPAAIRVLKGMVQGLFSFATFFLIVAGFIEKSGLMPTLLLSVTVALALQGGLAWLRVRLDRK